MSPILLFCCVITTLTFLESVLYSIEGTSPLEKIWYDVTYGELGYWNMYFNYGFSGELI